MPDHAHWLTTVFEPRRATLHGQLTTVKQQLEEAHDRYRKLTDDIDQQIKDADTKVITAGDDATDVEYLTARATQTEHDLLVATLEVTAAQSWLDVRDLETRRADLDLRICHLDALVEVGPIAAGNETLLEVVRIDVESAAADHAHAVADLERARRRLAATKRLHKEIQTALRQVKRADR